MNEELQSTNEELSTVNDELKTKVDQLTVANSDLRNFFESTDLAVVVLDRNLRIRSYTEAARAIFPLQPSDRGGCWPMSRPVWRQPTISTARRRSRAAAPRCSSG
ncbi:hypothetical protein GCM10020258_33880 [Sphingomonas yabuuchiae]